MPDDTTNGDHARTQTSANTTSALNLLDWFSSPRKYSKGQNFPFHLKAVKRFLLTIKAPSEYHLAILVNSLDEECQLELFAHPDYSEDETDFDTVMSLLSRIFDDKEAELSKLVRLLEIRQEPSELLSQFLTRIRVEAYKMMGDTDRSQNERFILSAFIHGLRDKSVGKAVETMRPENSDDALRLAKRAESKVSKNDILRIVEDKCSCKTVHTSKNDDLSEMKRQIQLLTQQVTYLSNKLRFKNLEINANVPRRRISQTYANAVQNGRSNRFQSNNQAVRSAGPNWDRRSQPIRCWNCNGEHILRQCTKKIFCKTCHRTGHVSRFCDSGEAVRYFHEEVPMREVDIVQNMEVESINFSSAESAESDEEAPLLAVEKLENENQDVALTEGWQKQRRRRNKMKHVQKENGEIGAWLQYINGKTNKMPEAHLSVSDESDDIRIQAVSKTRKSAYSPTIISSLRRERAANKPLVFGRCGSVRVPILIDSGAALNVIDEMFVRSLPPNTVVKIDNDESIIRCANDETVRSRGRITLSVQIGSLFEEMVFSVMPSLFPKVIIGLKQMKHSKMVVDPPLDALWVGGEKVNFISKTDELNKENL